MLGRAVGTVSVALLAFGCGSPTLAGYQSPPPPNYLDATTIDDVDAGPPTVCSDAGSSAAPGACQPKFASGLNVAWVNFARDVPNPNLPAFDVVFNSTYQNGGRVIRWWFHVDGRATPGYGADGNALPISCSEIGDLKSILDHAAAAKVMVLISLWSFNMLDGTISPTLRTNNMNLLMNDSNRQAYIDNYLKPLVAAVAGHPGLYGWEIFNEPEGMSNVADYTQPLPLPDGGVAHGKGPFVNESYVQRTLNWFSDAIHSVDPAALVTNGTWEFVANSNTPGMTNYYSDSNLLAAGGRDGGVLNFYEVHYYEGDGLKNSPFTNNASSWNLDKPVVVGEFDAIDTDGVGAGDLYTTLYRTGYGGAWAWKYLVADDAAKNNAWPAMQGPMLNVYDAGASDINCP